MKLQILAGCAALAMVSVGGSSAVSSSASGHWHPSCPKGAATDARLAKGATVKDPNSVTAARAAAIDRALQARLAAIGHPNGVQPQANRKIRVDVRMHVITTDDGYTSVTPNQLVRQVNVLNKGYSAQHNPNHAAHTPFWFQLKSVDYTANSDWYDWSYPGDDPSDDHDAKHALHKGGYRDLNLYVTHLGSGLLGYATFPGGKLWRDGVVVLDDSLPGGSAAPYNEGDTATHEVGHWLGLFHTFQNGCDAPGDRVHDTPYQDDGDNIFSCEESLDSCPAKPGLDPVHNYMSYGDDPCLNQFTEGQSVRMVNVWYAFRAVQP